MKRYLLFLLTFCLIFTTVVGCTLGKTVSKKEMDPYSTAVQAYIYGFPMVEFERTRRLMTNVEEPTNIGFAPTNQISHMNRLITAEDRSVVTPNTDTLYSSSFINLKEEPMILHVPDFGNRYFSFQFLSFDTDTFVCIGKRERTRPGSLAIKAPCGGDFVLVGPGWNGVLPKGVKRIDSPSNDIWMIHRPIVYGQEDVPKVMEIKKQITLTPLSYYGKEEPYQPKKGEITQLDPDVAKVGTPLVGIKFWEVLGDALKRNPIPENQKEMAAQLKKLGITEDGFNKDNLDEATLDAMIRATNDAKDTILENLKELKQKSIIDYWLYLPEGGIYYDDYLFRASIAAIGLGMLVPEEAAYPLADTDVEDKVLTGENKYLLEFSKDELPPVDAFWSLSMYNALDRFFVDNPINRYSIGLYTEGLKYNEDGSLTIYMQHESPGEELESNWLPTPEGPFYVVLRMYLPREEILEGKYNVPGIKRVEK